MTIEHSPKTLIIGGGAVGLCTAYYLNQRGHHVTVLEKGDYENGASHGNAGMLVPSHVVPLAAPGVIAQGTRWLFRRDSPFRIKPRLDSSLVNWLWKFRGFCTNAHVQAAMPVLRDLSLASLDLYAKLAADTGIDFDFVQRGLLMVHHTANGEKENLKYAKQAKSVGLDADILDKTALLRLEPQLRTAASGAVYYRQDAQLSPDRFIAGLKVFLEKQGVDFRVHTAVTGFTHQDNRLISINTTQGEFTGSEVILAAGSWSPTLGRLLGLNLPIQPAKGYSITLNALDEAPTIPMILTEAKVTITPMGNRLRFGGTLELAGYDNTIDYIRTNAIRHAVSHYCPAVEPNAIPTTDIWSGFRPCTPDGMPLIGRPRAWKNLIVATGHAMIGITLAPITGKLVSQIVDGHSPALNISSLSADRFA